jgi:hypothetical protein
MKKLILGVFILGGCILPVLGVPLAVEATDLGLLRTEYVFHMANDVSFCSVPGTSPKRNHTEQWYVTESGYLAAVEENLLDRAIFWAGMGDKDEFMRFIGSTDLVFPLKGGLRVYVEKFSFSGKVRIRPEGSDISVWTIREAIRSEFSVEGT